MELLGDAWLIERLREERDEAMAVAEQRERERDTLRVEAESLRQRLFAAARDPDLVQIARTERDAASADYARVEAERRGAEAEIMVLTQQRDEAWAVAERRAKERDAALDSYGRVDAERHEAWAEHDKMQIERDGAREEADRFQREAAAARREAERLAEEAAELQEALGTARLERDLVEFDRESLAVERDSARAEREAAREEREAARAEREAVRAEAESLRARAIALRCLGCGGWVLVDPGGSIPAHCEACDFDRCEAEREHAQEQSHWYEASLA